MTSSGSWVVPYNNSIYYEGFDADYVYLIQLHKTLTQQLNLYVENMKDVENIGTLKLALGKYLTIVESVYGADICNIYTFMANNASMILSKYDTLQSSFDGWTSVDYSKYTTAVENHHFDVFDVDLAEEGSEWAEYNMPHYRTYSNYGHTEMDALISTLCNGDVSPDKTERMQTETDAYLVVRKLSVGTLDFYIDLDKFGEDI
jgi:hypothetical protein